MRLLEGVRESRGHPAEAVFDGVRESARATAHVRLLGEGKVLVVVRVVLADEGPAPQPRRRVAQTSECSVDQLAPVSQRDLRVAQGLRRGGKLPRKKGGAEGILRSHRHRGPPVLFRYE